MPVRQVANWKEGLTFAKAVIVTHSAVFGRKETAVRAYCIDPVAPYAQYTKAVRVAFIKPNRRLLCCYDVKQDNLTFLTIEVGGLTVYDSRSEVPCDMLKWNATNEDWLVRGLRGAR